MDFFGKNKGTHSTQRKYFGTIPQSEFYGVAVGYAIGLFIAGYLRLETQALQLGLALAGLLIGYVYDKKYCQEKDEPEGGEADVPEADVPEAEAPEVPEDGTDDPEPGAE